MIVVPARALTLSYRMFMARRCRATGLLAAPRRLGEAVGDLGLGRTKDDAGMAPALGLRLPAHRILRAA